MPGGTKGWEYSVDLEEELTRLLGKISIVIPKPIVDELVFLSEDGKGRKKRLAKPSLELIKNYFVRKYDYKEVLKHG